MNVWIKVSKLFIAHKNIKNRFRGTNIVTYKGELNPLRDVGR